MFTPRHACVIVLNVKIYIININVNFDEVSIVTQEIMKSDPMLWLVTNDFTPLKQTHTYIHICS